MSHCHRHTWETAEGTCEECGLPFCASCLVETGGDGRSAGVLRCVPCALAVAGVRRSRQAKLGWRQRRQLAKLGS